ncbi:Tn3 family transposase [Streptomyces sp. NPDC093598]|uniref:Tn3 family transposase n=1 Tax=Streptomyces sp. NPDC093598 TaxID=3366046 RepID=UPI0037FC0DAA
MMLRHWGGKRHTPKLHFCVWWNVAGSGGFGARGCGDRPIGDGFYARAVCFVEGAHPTAPASEPLAAWAGGLVADLARCAIPADPTVDGDYRSYSQGEWEEWFAQAERLEVLSAEHVRILKGEIASNRRDEQEMFVLCLRILQSALVFVNTLMLQDLLGEPEWADILTGSSRRRSG